MIYKNTKLDEKRNLKAPTSIESHCVEEKGNIVKNDACICLENFYYFYNKLVK